MKTLIVAIDRGNFFIEDLIKRICKYAHVKKVFYDEIRSLEINKELIYTTPISDMGWRLRDFLKSHRVVNPLDMQDCFISKPCTDSLMMSYGFSVPKNTVADSLEELTNFINKNGIVILKQQDKCGGVGHFILKDDKAYAGTRAYNWMASMKLKKSLILNDRLLLAPPFYLQQFLPPDNDEIWRAYVVGNEVKFLSTRKRKEIRFLGEYVINVCKGAEYNLFEKSANEKVTDFASSILERIKIDVGTIDILIYDQRCYILEIDCDGVHTMICRDFYDAPSYDPSKFDLDLQIMDWLKFSKEKM